MIKKTSLMFLNDRIRPEVKNLQRGFSLIELLVVMAIIAILAVVAISSGTGTSKGAAALQGANAVADLFTLARSEAIKTQGSASVIVDAYPDPTNPLNYLHRLMVVDNSSDSVSYFKASPWYNLPNGIFYYPQFSGPPVTTSSIYIYNPPVIATPLPASAIFSGPSYVYSFAVNGQCGASQFVVASAAENTTSSPPTFTYPPSTIMEGFYLHSLGRPSFFPNPQSIPPTH